MVSEHPISLPKQNFPLYIYQSFVQVGFVCQVVGTPPLPWGDSSTAWYTSFSGPFSGYSSYILCFLNESNYSSVYPQINLFPPDLRNRVVSIHVPLEVLTQPEWVGRCPSTPRRRYCFFSLLHPISLSWLSFPPMRMNGTLSLSCKPHRLHIKHQTPLFG